MLFIVILCVYGVSRTFADWIYMLANVAPELQSSIKRRLYFTGGIWFLLGIFATYISATLLQKILADTYALILAGIFAIIGLLLTGLSIHSIIVNFKQYQQQKMQKFLS